MPGSSRKTNSGKADQGTSTGRLGLGDDHGHVTG
jgi:hypothetical protein